MILNCDFIHSFKIVVLQDSRIPWLVLDCTTFFPRRCIKFLVRLSLVHRPLRFICPSWLMIFNYCNLIIKARLVFSAISSHSLRALESLRQGFAHCSISFLFKLPLLVDFVFLAVSYGCFCCCFVHPLPHRSQPKILHAAAQESGPT